jgi:hypothetical protein
MPPLATHIRKQLETAIKKARVEAEAGARKALEALAVGRARAHESMDENSLELRRRLRAHGRQLGDALDAGEGPLATRRLEREAAYEHWHRMLFARYLAENQLLLEPVSRQAISLEESQELARDQSLDPWAYASSCAQAMLPRIFRADDPVLALALPPESRQALEKLLAELPREVFTADDSLGWTYQFWQAAEKDAVNAEAKSGKKITGETLPAVTQLFTEHYMVLFLLHNTLGAWHAARRIAADPAVAELARTASSEAELRRAVALPGVEWEYLRFVRAPKVTQEGGSRESEATDAEGAVDGMADDTVHDEGAPNSPWRPAAGAFASWPKSAAELRVLDPCCGSGHFLVAALEILAALRSFEEGATAEDALRAVLSDNLFGLELDARCTQIAAFNLALTVWKRVGAPIELPRLQLACCGIGPATTKDEWLELAEAAARAGGMPARRDLFGKEESLLSDAMRSGFEVLYELFSRAPELGSLIDPADLKSSLFQVSFKELEPLLERMLHDRDDTRRERAVAAAGMARAAQILRPPPGGYSLVVTNVPYLGRKSHTEELKAWVDAHYKEAKNDLATVFVQRMLRWTQRTGSVAAVTPQNWLFLTGYRKLREKLLTERSWNCVARLGAGAFETIGGHVVNVSLVSISGPVPADEQHMAGIDARNAAGVRFKSSILRGETLQGAPQDSTPSLAGQCAPESEASSAPRDPECEGDADATVDIPDGRVRLFRQSGQLENPDSRINLSAQSGCFLLSTYASSSHGVGTFDSPRFSWCFWESKSIDEGWVPQQTTPESTTEFGGCSFALRWEAGRGQLAAAMKSKESEGYTSGKWRAGVQQWGQSGVLAGQMNHLPSTRYVGRAFDENASVVVPSISANESAIWAFCASQQFVSEIRRIDDSIKVTCKSLVKVPFDLAHWQRVAAERYPEGLPEPQSNDPTQWLFHGHPAGMLAAGPASRSPFGIADAVGAERHPSLICREPNLRDVLQVAVARLLGYRWPAEHDAEMKLDVAARAWVDKCRELDPLADEDGIVCLASVRGEPSAADRLRKLLTAAFECAPGGFTAARERELLAAAAEDARPADSLEEWLRDEFFEQHNTLFHSRPFVWHVWDGRADGFHALVNYHRLAGPDGEGQRTLKLLVYTYLGEWIERQKAEQAEGREGADGRLRAALALQGHLEAILNGEPPYDLFIRWKPLHEQPLGWSPDINDGVRLNIRPFLLAADMGPKGAGLLRTRPKGLKWKNGAVDKADRGKEPQSIRPRADFPWFWSCSPIDTPAHRINFGAPLEGATPAGATFDGVRWNDLHYTRAAKEAARKAAREGRTS